MARRIPPARGAARRFWVGRRLLAATAAAAAVAWSGSGFSQNLAQGFTIIPVTVELEPRQFTAVLTVQNDNDQAVDFQVRPFAWSQPQGRDELTATDNLVVSPPLGAIPAHSRQVVRLVLRGAHEPQKEVAYRILFDQIPPPPAPGTVGFAVRLSMPVFVEPDARTPGRVRWRVEMTSDGAYLVGVNEGARRVAVRDMALLGPGGQKAALESGVSPYILAGVTRRWRIEPSGAAPVPGQDFRLTAHADTGAIDQPVPVSRGGL